MATGTWVVTKQMMTAIQGPANPGDLHIPIGFWSAGTGWATRVALYAPINFSGMTGINEARLYLRANAPASGFHTKGLSTASLYVSRRAQDWSEGSHGGGTGIDETWDGNGAAIVTTNNILVESGDAAAFGALVDNDWYYIPITQCVTRWFEGHANYGLVVYNETSENNSAFSKQFWSRYSANNAPYIWIDYNTNQAPNAPINLSPTGDAITNQGQIVTFSVTRSDPDASDGVSGWDVQVWDDAMANLLNFEVFYPGGLPATIITNLSVINGGNKFYRWRARTRDKGNLWGPFSAFQRFKANTIPNPPTVSLQQTPTSSVKTLTPTFNITRNDADSAYGDYMAAYQITLYRDSPAGTLVWDSGAIGTAVGTSTIAKLYNGPALEWQKNYYWYARTQDSNGAWGNYSTVSSFTTYTIPLPVSLNPSGSTVVGTLTPTLTGSRATSDASIASYQIQLYESNGTTLKWDSGTLSTGITNGATFSKVYNGAALSFSSTYKWRARITGNIGGTSAWTSLQTFITGSATTPTQNTPIGAPITDLTPDFTGTWSENLNGVQVRVYESDGTTLKWDSGQVAKTSAASYTHTYAGTALLWNTTYKWQVSVRRSADNVWQPFTGLATFATDSAGQPTLTAPISNSWQTTLTPTFTGNTFNAEVITTFRIRLYESDGVTLTWDSGDLAGSGTSFSKVYNGANVLVGGRSYKWQARYIKSTGPTGDYSPLADFHVNATPQSPSNVQPATGAIAGTLTPTFTADFEDSDEQAWGDLPVQMEIEVRNNATDALIATQVKTTGLVGGTNSIVWDGTPALVYETVYKWRVRYRDSKNVDGAWSSYNTIKPSQPSTVLITGPTVSISSPQVPVTWTFSSPSGKAQGSYRVRVVRNSDSIVVYDTDVVISTANNHIIPAGYLQNNTAYTFEVVTVDTDGI